MKPLVPIQRFGVMLFAFELVLAITFAFTAIPAKSTHEPIVNAPGLVAIVIFAAYASFAVSLLLFIYAATVDIFKRSYVFWDGLISVLLGFPILLWGAFREDAIYESIPMTTLSVAVALAIGALLSVKLKLSKTWGLPLALLIGDFLVAFLIPNAWWVHLIVGSILLYPIVAFFARVRRSS